MYTVKELIETLNQCPADYEVHFFSLYEGICFDIDTVGIDHEEKCVVLFD